jgi:hypothetical protein
MNLPFDKHPESVVVAAGAAAGAAVGHIPGVVVGAQLASKVAFRAGSEAVNAIQLYRLGKTTIRQLQPLQERPGAG